MPISAIQDIIEDIRQGRMVILMDDEDRENEGDLIIAAEAVTPELITFFASHACGLICLPITEERARRLALPLMVQKNQSQHETNFTVSIDAAVLPGYLRQLNAEERFNGRPFAQLQLRTLDEGTNAGHTEFVLRSLPPAREAAR